MGASPSSRPVSPPATDIPINCITLLFRLHLFGNLTSKSTFLSQRDCARVQVSLNIHICSVLPGVASWRWSRAAAKWAAAGRDRKPGVKDILRAEIMSRCWEHEQAVRVSFTHHGSSVYVCMLSGKKLHKVLVISSRTHRRSCQCCARWTSWTRDLRRPATSCGMEGACTRGAGIWPTELPLNISNC